MNLLANSSLCISTISRPAPLLAPGAVPPERRSLGEFPEMAESLAGMAAPVLSQVMDCAVAALAAQGFTRVWDSAKVVRLSERDQLTVLISCQVEDVSRQQRLAVLVVYALSQSQPWLDPAVTGKVYLLVGLADEMLVHTYHRTGARTSAMLTQTTHEGTLLQPEFLGDSVELLAINCAPGAEVMTRYAELISASVVGSLEP